MDCTSDSLYKIRVFIWLFKGRDDVYAKRWENKNKLYAALEKDVIENHLRGNIVVGIYPMLPDETCRFLAMDFDGANWQKDITVLRKICAEFGLPSAIERSRSGKGGHIWRYHIR